MLKSGAFDPRTTRSANVLSLLPVSMIAVAVRSPAVRASALTTPDAADHARRYGRRAASGSVI